MAHMLWQSNSHLPLMVFSDFAAGIIPISGLYSLNYNLYAEKRIFK